jgi:hypothetical protein
MAEPFDLKVLRLNCSLPGILQTVGLAFLGRFNGEEEAHLPLHIIYINDGSEFKF